MQPGWLVTTPPITEQRSPHHLGEENTKLGIPNCRGLTPRCWSEEGAVAAPGMTPITFERSKPGRCLNGESFGSSQRLHNAALTYSSTCQAPARLFCVGARFLQQALEDVRSLDIVRVQR